MSGRSVLTLILIIFLFVWTLTAVRELFTYEKQKKEVEKNIQQRISEILGKQNINR